MAADHTSYLAANVLNDGKPITYRTLSRALKVHGNVAKKMLYDFHHRQNSKKPGSVHATYLIIGSHVLRSSQANGAHQTSLDDANIPSSPYISSSMPDANEDEEDVPLKTTVVSLVKEELLRETQAQYDTISSIHIFSLQSSSIQNLQILSDNTRRTIADQSREDPLTYGKRYGVIQNSLMKRRTGAKPVVQVPASAPKARLAPSSAQAPQTSAIKSASNNAASQTKVKVEVKTESQTKKPPSMNREKSDIFKSFAKAKPKLKKEESNSPVNVQDVSMRDGSDDEDNDDGSNQFQAESQGPQRNLRAERQAKLRKMMEDDDEEDEEEDAKMKDAPGEEEPEPEPQQEKARSMPSREETPPVTVSGGRRQGKRRVTKKTQETDADGFLVTTDEQVWESFSEEDTIPIPKPKPSLAVSAKAKKGTAKPGQGNIMSFFGKK